MDGFTIAILVAIVAVGAFMMWERSFKSAALLFSIPALALSGLIPQAEPKRQTVSSRVHLASAPQSAKLVDPGPRRPTEIAFELAAAVCPDEGICVTKAVTAAFGDNCKERVRTQLQTDYKFHEDEPLFADVRRVSDVDYVASGRSLFLQTAGSASLDRSQWICFIKRHNGSGVRVADYWTVAVRRTQ